MAHYKRYQRDNGEFTNDIVSGNVSQQNIDIENSRLRFVDISWDISCYNLKSAATIMRHHRFNLFVYNWIYHF